MYRDYCINHALIDVTEQATMTDLEKLDKLLQLVNELKRWEITYPTFWEKVRELVQHS